MPLVLHVPAPLRSAFAACDLGSLRFGISGVSLRFGMRHEFGAGVAVEESWDDPVLFFEVVVFDEIVDSVSAVWITGCERAVVFRGHEGADGDGLDTGRFTSGCLSCLCRWGEA